MRDYGRWDYSPSTDERGRGLGLMRGLMNSVQIRRTPRGSALVMSHVLPSVGDGELLAVGVEDRPPGRGPGEAPGMRESERHEPVALGERPFDPC